MVNIIFANILIIVIILSVKRTTINGITTTRRVHVCGHDLGLGRLMVLLLWVMVMIVVTILVLVMVLVMVLVA